jgi:hypothetical protein
LKVRGNGCTVGPVSAIHPGRFLLVISLAIFVLFGVGYRKVDDIFAVDSVYHTVFAQAANYLHFNHSAHFLDRKDKIFSKEKNVA